MKLFAALGPWVGPYLALWIFLVSALVLFLEALVLVVGRFLTQGAPAALAVGSSRQGKRGPAETGGGKRSSHGPTYSFPLALATALVLLWFFRVDLHLAAPKEAGRSESRPAFPILAQEVRS